jgi:7-carboxy-7-deazaguanine synthase
MMGPSLDLTVAEVYGPVFQGEGPSAGTRCSFVRLGGCNLTCGWRRTRGGLERVPWAWACDEAATWHSGMVDLRSALTAVPAGQITDAALACDPPLVVVTGGEPLLHQDRPGWPVLIGGLLAGGTRRVEIETNGVLVPVLGHKRIRYNVSPKLASSGVALPDRLRWDALEWHAAHRSVVKFVATSPGDVAEAAAIAARAGWTPDRVWFMPEGTTAAAVLACARAIAPAVAGGGFNLTLRQHVLLYDTDREPR